jgi:hypothetical protein
MEIVNGIPCLNCSDVERAKKASPGNSNALNENAFLADLAAARDFGSANSPLDFGDRGRTVNFGT